MSDLGFPGKTRFWLWDFFRVWGLIEGGFGRISVKHALNPDFSGPSAALKIWWKTRVLCNSRVSSPEPRFSGPGFFLGVVVPRSISAAQE